MNTLVLAVAGYNLSETGRMIEIARAAREHFDILIIRPGKPVDNAHIESFNGRLRDECLNSKWFESLDDARRALQDWRRDYNEVRPHSSLWDMPPSAFAARIQGLQPDSCSRA
jgi:putative transposase